MFTFRSFKIKTYCTDHNFQVSNVMADKCNVQVYWTMSKHIHKFEEKSYNQCQFMHHQ